MVLLQHPNLPQAGFLIVGLQSQARGDICKALMLALGQETFDTKMFRAQYCTLVQSSCTECLDSSPYLTSSADSLSLDGMTNMTQLLACSLTFTPAAGAQLCLHFARLARTALIAFRPRHC